MATTEMATMPAKITADMIDPEIRDLIWSLTPEEDALLDFQLVQAGCARDPLVVWYDLDQRKWVLLDGHNRWRICSKHGLKYDIVVATGVHSRADALAYVERNQLGRRNTSRHQWAYLVGGRYNREKAQGSRSDLHTGKPVSTAERIAAEHNVSGRAIESCGRFRSSMDYVREVLSVDACAAIMTGEAKISREEIVQLSSLEADAITEIWEEWERSGKTGMARLIAKRNADKKPPKPKSRPATDRYPLADLVRLIAMNWTPQALADALEAGAISQDHLAVVQQHLGGALRNLIGIATETGHGLEALDAWIDAQQEALNAPNEPSTSAEETVEGTTLTCAECGSEFVHPTGTRGRKPTKCLDCR